MALWMGTVATIVAVAVGIGTLWRWAFGPLRRAVTAVGQDVRLLANRVDTLEVARRDVGEQVGGLTRALVRLLADRYTGQPEKVAELLGTFHGTWRGVVGHEQAQHNPLTLEELARFEAYRTKFYERGQALTRAEWSDFHGMLEKMNDDRPKPPGLAALFVLSAILAALAGTAVGAPGVMRRPIRRARDAGSAATETQCPCGSLGPTRCGGPAAIRPCSGRWCSGGGSSPWSVCASTSAGPPPRRGARAASSGWTCGCRGSRNQA